MDLKKYHTIKITLNALILLVLIGCSANQVKNTQAHQAQNNDSFNIDIGSVILSSKYSESEYKLIERMLAFRSFSEENFSELGKINFEKADLATAAAAFFIVLLMPLTFSITNGIAAGFVVYTIIKLARNEREDLNLGVMLLTVISLLVFILQG